MQRVFTYLICIALLVVGVATRGPIGALLVLGVVVVCGAHIVAFVREERKHGKKAKAKN